MLVLITYDVNTEDPAGRKRLRKIAKQWYRILYLNVFWMLPSAARSRQRSYPLWMRKGTACVSIILGTITKIK